MNKLFVIVLLFIFVGLTCSASSGFDWSFIGSLKDRIMYLKDWFLSDGAREEFRRELSGLKQETPLLFREIWTKIKGFSI